MLFLIAFAWGRNLCGISIVTFRIVFETMEPRCKPSNSTRKPKVFVSLQQTTIKPHKSRLSSSTINNYHRRSRCYCWPYFRLHCKRSLLASCTVVYTPQLYAHKFGYRMKILVHFSYILWISDRHSQLKIVHWNSQTFCMEVSVFVYV